jgi:AcrR family transcriptional regulator
MEASILSATHTLLHDRSAADVTISDVMDVVGLSRTAFYRYFPDVITVLVRLLDEVQSEFIGSWLEAPLDADFQQVLVADARANIARFQVHGAILQACLDARSGAPELHAAWISVVNRIIERAGLRITQLNAAGVSKVQHPMETARALVLMTINYAMEGLQRLSGDESEILGDTLGDVWFRAIFCLPVAA